MLNQIRSKLRPFIEACARPFVRVGVSSNHITLIGLVVGVFAGFLFAFGRPVLAGVVVLLGGFFDVIDGAVARLAGQVTDIGGVLDSVCDRVADGALFVGIMAGGFGSLFGEPNWVLPVFALLGSLLVSYVRARAEAAGTGKLDVGIAERAERIIIIAAGAFFGLIPHVLVIIIVLTSVTIVRRVWEAQVRLSGPET